LIKQLYSKKNKHMNLRVGFVGLSHLGLNYLAAAAEKNFKTIGFDMNSKLISKLNKFDVPLSEPYLEKNLRKNKNLISFSDDFSLIKKCDIVFISQDVKTNKNGTGKLEDIKFLINYTKKFIKKETILVILSQIQPKFMKNIKFDKTRLFYQVETLVFGRAVERALYPERIIIGCYNKNIPIKKKYLVYLKKFKCPLIKMKYESAELTKIAINTFLTSSITTTNVLSEICNRVSADWSEIKPAIMLDERIGKKAYLNPGLGISGGNLERDISSLKKLIKSDKNLKLLTDSFEKNSKYMKSWVYRILKKRKLLNNSKNSFSILGVSYKENTNSIKNSPSIELIQSLKGKNLRVYDPKAVLQYKQRNCIQFKSIDQALLKSKILILMVPWKEFKNIKVKKNIKLIIDPFRILKNKNIPKKKIEYYSLGK
tara:strand:+ start:1140 stop:2420 length:1281 start_codon:yes stop_codon:yes gene_type:complete